MSFTKKKTGHISSKKKRSLKKANSSGDGTERLILMSYEQFAYTYDRLMEGMPYSDWLAFAKESWRKYGLVPRTLVDLGCGTGSLAIPLAIEGFHVTGIDLSEDMLAVAQHKAEEKNLLQSGTLSWIQQDLREWELPEQVDAVISFCDCINYLLEEEEVVQAFRQTFAGLRSGGVFLFDAHTPQQLFAYADSQPFFLNDDDVSYIWTSELDEERVQIEHALTIFTAVESGSGLFTRIDETHKQRAYELKWLEKMLQDAGFVDVIVSADFRRQEPTPSSERAFFSCRKPCDLT
jgi:SAM-dependent methyltransferase